MILLFALLHSVNLLHLLTKEAKLINEVYYLPVDERSKDMWVKQIVELQRHRRYDTYSELERCGFDIHQTVEELMNLYKI